MQKNDSERRDTLGAVKHVARAGLMAAAVLAATEAHAEVRARFSPGSGILTVTGGREDDRIAVSRSFGGAISVNEGAIPIRGGGPDVGNTRRIVVRGGRGNDRLELDESNGALPQAVLVGGPGNDVLRGGSNGDDLRGGPGDDRLDGLRGADRIRGDGGDDVVNWYGGEGADRVDGGPGTDRVQIRAPEPQDNDVAILRGGRSVVVAFAGATPLELEHLRVERFLVFGGDRNDVIEAAPDLGKGVTLSLYGGSGRDFLVGTDAADLLVGGSGQDILLGMGGNDSLVGEGDDDALDGGGGDDAIDGGPGWDAIDGGPGTDVATNGELVLNVP